MEQSSLESFKTEIHRLLISKLGLPSIAVTIGTLTLFRGISEIILAPRTITGFPTSLTKIGVEPIGGTELSYTTVIFLIMAIWYLRLPTPRIEPPAAARAS